MVIELSKLSTYSPNSEHDLIVVVLTTALVPKQSVPFTIQVFSPTNGEMYLELAADR